jgi:uncharacterized protein YlxW (UPF0749 family)
MADIAEKGLDVITPFPQGDLALFRRFELAAAINRVRTLEVKSVQEEVKSVQEEVESVQEEVESVQEEVESVEVTTTDEDS